MKFLVLGCLAVTMVGPSLSCSPKHPGVFVHPVPIETEVEDRRFVQPGVSRESIVAHFGLPTEDYPVPADKEGHTHETMMYEQRYGPRPPRPGGRFYGGFVVSLKDGKVFSWEAINM